MATQRVHEYRWYYVCRLYLAIWVWCPSAGSKSSSGRVRCIIWIWWVSVERSLADDPCVVCWLGCGFKGILVFCVLCFGKIDDNIVIVIVCSLYEVILQCEIFLMMKVRTFLLLKMILRQGFEASIFLSCFAPESMYYCSDSSPCSD